MGVFIMDYILGERGGFWRKGLFAVLLVILADALLFESGMGSVLGIFALAWGALSFAAQRSSWKKPASLIAFALAALFGGILTYDPSFLGWVLFCTMLAVAVLLPQIQGVGDGWYWSKRLVYHGAGTPFGPLLDLVRLSKAHRRPGTRMSVAHMLPNLILPLVGTALFLGLFAMANPIIEEFLGRIQIGGLTAEDIGRVIFWGFAFVLVWSTLRPRRTKHMFHQLVDSEPSRIPGVTVASVTLSLALFNLLFALQNGMDLIYIWGDVRLPEAFTLAEYAHRGAYPLIVTALLAGLFILVTTHPKSAMAGNRLIRWLIILWIGQNLFLVASTVERTLLYIDSYSLTRLRIAALLWMGLVGIGLVLVTWRMLRGNGIAWLVNGNILAALAVLGVCTYIDLGEMAARWNVRHAQEVGGEGVHLDLCYLNNLDGSALLPLASLEQRANLEPSFKQRVTLVRQQAQQRVVDRQAEKGGWRWRDAQRLAELRRFSLKNLGIPKGYYVTCGGHLAPIGDRSWDAAHDGY
jgi:Domain of unknown function (DUF4173)